MQARIIDYIHFSIIIYFIFTSLADIIFYIIVHAREHPPCFCPFSITIEAVATGTIDALSSSGVGTVG